MPRVVHVQVQTTGGGGCEVCVCGSGVSFGGGGYRKGEAFFS